MNKVYKSIWNAVTRSWTAVSEWQTSRGKRSTKNKKTLAVSLTLLTSLAVTSQFAYAAGIYGILGNNTISLAPIFIGDNSQTSISQENYTSLNHVGNSIGIELSTVNADINKIDPFEQSTKGFIQAILYSENLVSNATRGQVHEVFDLSNYNNIVQGVTQGSSSQPVAYFSYATGQRVYNLYTKQENESVLDKYRAYTVAENGQFYFDADSTSMGFTDDGIAWNENGDGGREGIYLLTLLTDINLASTLQLNVNNTQDLAARLNNYTSSTGNIEYVGSGADSSNLNIIGLLQVDENGQAYNNANTYSGTTTVTDLTLNLNKEKSLGNTSGLTVTRSVVNFGTDSEVVSGNAQFALSSNLNVDNHRFEVTGNATFDDSSLLRSSGDASKNSGFIVGGELTIHSDNSGNLTGVVSASSAELTDINALDEGSLYVTSNTSNTNNGRVHLNLAGVNDQQDVDPDTVALTFDNVVTKSSDEQKVTVELTNSRASTTDTRTELYLKYGDQNIDADATIINTDVTLMVNGLDQLGSVVTLNGLNDTSFSTLQINGTAGSDGHWTFEDVKIQSSETKKKEDILEVNGTGFQLTESALEGYYGWLRLGNDVELILNAGTSTQSYLYNAGVGLGKGSTLSITGTDTVTLKRFGWSGANGGGGLLNLLDFDFANANGASALEVTEQLELRGIGSIALDPGDVLSGVSKREGHILGLDNNDNLNTTNSYKLISLVGDAQLDDSMTGSEGISIVDADGNPIQSSTDTSKFQDLNGNDVATGYWGYNTSKLTDGLYLTYNLTQLNVDNNDAEHALIIALADDTDNELSAKLTGNGYVKVDADTNAETDVFKITNRANTFQGTIEVDSGLTIEATTGALGNVSEDNNGVNLVLGDESNFTLTSSTDTTSRQILSGLYVGDSSTITLGEETILELALTADTTWNSVTLSGDGGLVLSKGTLEINNADKAFENFSKRLGVSEGASLQLVGTDPQNSRHNLNYLTGSGTLGLENISAIVGSGENVPNFFSGNYELHNSSNLIFNADSNLAWGGDIVVDGEATISFNNIINGTAPTIILDGQNAEPSLVLTNSEIDLNWSSVKNAAGSSIDVTDSLKIFNTTLDSQSVLNNFVTGNNSTYTVDLSQVTGYGHIWLDFENLVEDLNLNASDEQNGLKVGINNATITLSQSEDLSVVDNLRLHIGENSTLFTDGQVNLKQGLTLGSGSTLNFTLNEDNYNDPGDLSYNGIVLGQEGQGGELVIDGSASVDVVFNPISIDNSLTDGANGDSILDYLNKDSESTVVDVITNIDLSNGSSLAQLEGALNVIAPDGTKLESVDIDQGGTTVAKLYTGMGIIGVEESDGTGTLGVGGKVTKLELLNGHTLALDIDSSTSDSAMSVKVTGDGNLLFASGSEDRVITVSGADSTFTGKTVITDGANIKLINDNALSSNSTQIVVGGKVEGLTQTSESGSLIFETNNTNLDQYTQQLTVATNGTVDLDSANTSSDNYAHIHIVSDNSELTSSIEGVLKGGSNSAVYIQKQTQLDISSADMSDFNGTFVGTGNAQLVYNFTDEDRWTINSEFTGNASLVLNGEGTFFVDNDSKGDLSVTAQAGTINFTTANSNLNRLEASSNSKIQMNGLLTVNNFTSDGSILEMDVSLGTSDQTDTGLAQNGNDGLLVSGTASGSVGVLVADKNQLKKGQEESITLIQVDGDASDFSAQLVDENGSSIAGITAGGYDYVLLAQDQTVQSTGRDVATGTDYILTSKPGEEEKRNTTVTAGSYIGIAYAAQLFDLSLHDRVGNRDWINPMTGEKQTTSLWMHHTMSHERYRDSTAQLRMRTTANTTMLGGDLVQFTTGDTGLAYAGLMGGYGSMDTKSRSKVTHLHSKAETDAWGVGAYAGWKANSDGQTGPYVDGWVMFTHASSDVTGVDQNTEDVKGQGLSASLETGWGFKVGSVATENGKIANFTVEPHASVTWFGMQYDEIHNDAQDVKFEGENNVRTRLGTRAILTQEGNNDFNAFVEANWVHNTQEYGATISGLTVDQAGSRNQGEGRIGVDWRVTDSLSVWGRVGASFGSDNYNEREGSIGVRYQF